MIFKIFEYKGKQILVHQDAYEVHVISEFDDGQIKSTLECTDGQKMFDGITETVAIAMYEEQASLVDQAFEDESEDS